MAVQRVTQTETIDTTAEPVQPVQPVQAVDEKTANYSAFDQLVYLIFGIIEVLLLIRFLFRMTGANAGAGIVAMIYSVTRVLMAPFNFVFPVNAVEGAVFEWSILVAMAFYALLAWIIMKLIRILYTADAAK